MADRRGKRRREGDEGEQERGAPHISGLTEAHGTPRAAKLRTGAVLRALRLTGAQQEVVHRARRRAIALRLLAQPTTPMKRTSLKRNSLDAKASDVPVGELLREQRRTSLEHLQKRACGRSSARLRRLQRAARKIMMVRAFRARLEEAVGERTMAEVEAMLEAVARRQRRRLRRRRRRRLGDGRARAAGGGRPRGGRDAARALGDARRLGRRRRRAPSDFGRRRTDGGGASWVRR